MKEKRLLAILGSPHKGGNTAAMLDAAVEEALRQGWTVDRVALYEKKIGFCKGCRVCLETQNCVVQDDIQEIAALLRSCDVVALAAPTYWGNVPAAVKNMFDRLLGVAMEETGTFPKPRLSQEQTCLLLTACHTPAPFSWLFGQSRGALRAMREFFKTAGMRCGGTFVWSNTGRKTELPMAFRKKMAGYWKD